MVKKKLQKLPVGVQSFEDLRTDNYLYVDKTKEVYDLATQGKAYFLSRPRRFGKSLLCSTFKTLFEAKKELFKGTWIATSDWEWQEHPVIHLDLSKIPHKNQEGLEKALTNRLIEIGKIYKIKLEPQLPGAVLAKLIDSLATQGPKPVLLIDEYDQPIIAHLGDDDLCESYRGVMQDFYKPLKACSDSLRFLFITGVSQFAKMSIFSALNHLRILSGLASSATICGYTQEELEHHFAPYIAQAASHNGLVKKDLLAKIKQWYNGYCFANPQKAPHRVYNPFSIVNFFADDNAEFKDYWFASGTPTFVMQYFKKHQFKVADFEKVKVLFSELGSLQLADIELSTLLYQAGYMTIQSYNAETGVCVLQFPNYEISTACSQQLIAYATTKTHATELSELAIELRDLFLSNTISAATLAVVLKNICAHIPSTVAPQKEKGYQLLFWAVLRISGLNAVVEEPSAVGRMDITITLADDQVFIIELKIRGSVEKALKQIIDRRYAEKYEALGKKVTRIGVVFDIRKRTITSCALIKPVLKKSRAVAKIAVTKKAIAKKKPAKKASKK